MFTMLIITLLLSLSMFCNLLLWYESKCIYINDVNKEWNEVKISLASAEGKKRLWTEENQTVFIPLTFDCRDHVNGHWFADHYDVRLYQWDLALPRGTVEWYEHLCMITVATTLVNRTVKRDVDMWAVVDRVTAAVRTVVRHGRRDGTDVDSVPVGEAVSRCFVVLFIEFLKKLETGEFILYSNDINPLYNTERFVINKNLKILDIKFKKLSSNER